MADIFDSLETNENSGFVIEDADETFAPVTLGGDEPIVLGGGEPIVLGEAAPMGEPDAFDFAAEPAPVEEAKAADPFAAFAPSENQAAPLAGSFVMPVVSDAPLRNWEMEHQQKINERMREESAKAREQMDKAQQEVDQFIADRKARCDAKARQNKFVLPF